MLEIVSIIHPHSIFGKELKSAVDSCYNEGDFMVLQGRCGRHFEIVRDRMIKIIFSDMDGTLLDEHGNVQRASTRSLRSSRSAA